MIKRWECVEKGARTTEGTGRGTVAWRAFVTATPL